MLDEKDIQAIAQLIEMLDTYYRITRLEGDNTKILLQMITDIRKEVEELKQKTA